ncbi:hypothetical protein MSI_17730 [Treponema sp. JC4]|uniref:DUF4405 domain-containing protein n=1 Tax=Treponema sp. JC4 TaxID=1124982 RepID=UPI00025B055A|nr:DUF4405 domain-containing protein [Treponema sp. JC4]EID84724.1 hypothetical protein MSI_17730 [Treponema sp. JC4]
MNTNKLRMPLDILMTLLSIILMGGTVLFPDDRIHQICGISLIVLWVVHIVLNRRWYSSLFKGKYQPYRIMQLVVNCGVLICALFLMISDLLMAWFIPADWVGGALGFARTTHLLASHWYYIFMAFHIGLHASMIATKIKIRGIVPRLICILISLYGVYAFIARGLWKYMFGLQQFFFFDFERGYMLFVLDYISIIVLFGTVSYYIGKLFTRGKK